LSDGFPDHIDNLFEMVDNEQFDVTFAQVELQTGSEPSREWVPSRGSMPTLRMDASGAEVAVLCDPTTDVRRMSAS
jgi:hypothetical protein